MKNKIEELFQYNLSLDYEELKKKYKGGGTCLDTIPQAISLFLDSNDFEDSIRKAVSIGGDSDTIACLVGSLAEIYYKEIDEKLKENVLSHLPKEFKSLIKELEKINK